MEVGHSKLSSSQWWGKGLLEVWRSLGWSREVRSGVSVDQCLLSSIEVGDCQR
jgi:hypothetical protein